VQNAEIGISHHSMDNQAPKKEHLMKSGIALPSAASATSIFKDAWMNPLSSQPQGFQRARLSQASCRMRFAQGDHCKKLVSRRLRPQKNLSEQGRCAPRLLKICQL
jgi:hypothetical protein